jgi:hypothetical protein
MGDVADDAGNDITKWRNMVARQVHRAFVARHAKTVSQRQELIIF